MHTVLPLNIGLNLIIIRRLDNPAVFFILNDIGGINIMSRKSRKQKPFSFRGKPKMTVGYIRLSVSDTEKENSIEIQKHIIELWCVQHEMTIDKFYIDNGYSGRRFDRPAFTEMLNDIAEDKIACVIVKDLCGQWCAMFPHGRKQPDRRCPC